jgi:hypothetical protein
MNLDRDQLMLVQLAVKVSRTMPELGSFTSEKAHLEAVQDRAGQMMMELRSGVLGARILSDRQDFGFEYPASWWQHFKRDKMPGWFTRRYPVRMRKLSASVDFTRYDTYPMADVPLPPDEFGYPVIVETFRWTGPGEIIEEVSGRPRHRYVSHHALGFMIASELLERDVLPLSGREDVAPGVIRQIVSDTLATLKSYGVNPDQLVREDVLRGRP